MNAISKFWTTIAPGPGGCWLWTGDTNQGYGRMIVYGKSVRAHRFGYELIVGPFPLGKVSDHLCRMRACVNPFHIEPVPNKVNVLRGIGRSAVNAAKVACKNGHEFDSVHGTRRPRRVCVQCHNEKSRESKAKMRADPEWVARQRAIRVERYRRTGE